MKQYICWLWQTGRALEFEVEVQGTKWRPNRTWKRQVEEESIKLGQSMGDGLRRSQWIVGVDQIATRLR